MTAEFEDVTCPIKDCDSGLFKMEAKPRLWMVYCAVEGCGTIIADVPKSSIIPLLWKKYGLDEYEVDADQNADNADSPQQPVPTL